MARSTKGHQCSTMQNTNSIAHLFADSHGHQLILVCQCVTKPSCQKKKTLPLGTPKWKSLKRFKDANFWFWKKITAGYFVFQVQVLEGISSFKMLETKTTCKPMIHTRSTTCVFGYGPMTLYMPWPFIMPVSKRPFLSIAPEKTTCIYPIYTHHKRCIYRVDYSGAPIPKLPPHVSPTNNPTSGW